MCMSFNRVDGLRSRWVAALMLVTATVAPVAPIEALTRSESASMLSTTTMDVVHEKSVEWRKQLEMAIDGAKRTRDAFGNLRATLNALPNVDPTPESDEKAIFTTIERFRIGLRQPPVSEVRKQFLRLTRLESSEGAREASGRGRTALDKDPQQLYRSVTLSLERLDTEALQATRSHGEKLSEHLALLRSKLFDQTLHAMDAAIDGAAHELESS